MAAQRARPTQAQRGAATPTQAAEISYQVRRLAAHPSLAVWAAVNEAQVAMGDATAIYVTFAMEIVAKEDPTRPPWPASPSLGWEKGVRTLAGLPHGAPLRRHGCYFLATLGFGVGCWFAPQHSYFRLRGTLPNHAECRRAGIEFVDPYAPGGSAYPRAYPTHAS